ncbi:MAG: hypothetical protein H7061_13650 [Bdellovibrionaceae bacterium]|nr:hypothetical protein [Bdellovibrio sp.]
MIKVSSFLFSTFFLINFSNASDFSSNIFIENQNHNFLRSDVNSWKCQMSYSGGNSTSIILLKDSVGNSFFVKLHQFKADLLKLTYVDFNVLSDDTSGLSIVSFSPANSSYRYDLDMNFEENANCIFNFKLLDGLTVQGRFQCANLAKFNELSNKVASGINAVGSFTCPYSAN